MVDLRRGLNGDEIHEEWVDDSEEEGGCFLEEGLHGVSEDRVLLLREEGDHLVDAAAERAAQTAALH